MRKPVEGDFQWIKPDGKPTQYFLELIQELSNHGLTRPVSKTDPTNGQVLKYVAANGRYEPGTDNT